MMVIHIAILPTATITAAASGSVLPTLLAALLSVTCEPGQNLRGRPANVHDMRVPNSTMRRYLRVLGTVQQRPIAVDNSQRENYRPRSWWSFS